MQNASLLASWAYNNVEQIIFYALALAAIPLAYGVIFDRNIIRSGFLLIGVFGAISGLFLLQDAQFLALAQIMIYGVGITLVVVIALMLTNPKLGKEENPSLKSNIWPGTIVSTLLFATIYFSLKSNGYWPFKMGLPANPAINVKILGIHLMTYYSLPFEFASLLLLAALMGAIILAKAEPTKSGNNTQKRSNNDVVKV